MAVSEESQRRGKLGASNYKNLRVHVLEADGEKVEPGGQTQSKKSGTKKEPKPDRPDRLMVTLEAVQSDIAILKEALGSQNAPEREGARYMYPYDNQRRRLCKVCQRANQYFCDHCFRCGSSDHFSQGCRRGVAGTTNQGNRRAATRGQGVAVDHIKQSMFVPCLLTDKY